MSIDFAAFKKDKEKEISSKINKEDKEKEKMEEEKRQQEEKRKEEERKRRKAEKEKQKQKDDESKKAFEDLVFRIDNLEKLLEIYRKETEQNKDNKDNKDLKELWEFFYERMQKRWVGSPGIYFNLQKLNKIIEGIIN